MAHGVVHRLSEGFPKGVGAECAVEVCSSEAFHDEAHGVAAREGAKGVFAGWEEGGFLSGAGVAEQPRV
jgi:hypothetical protein